MFSLTDLKNLDLEQLDPTRLDLTRFDLRNIELPDIDMPVEATRLVGFARDTAYAGVGVVVITVKKADGQRRELAAQVSNQVHKLVDAVS